MKSICVIGASYLWTKTLIGDLLACFVDEALDVRFADLHEEPARICKEWGEAVSKACGRSQDRYHAYTDRKQALAGADAVLITISTGGLKAMKHDLEIPEAYGIYATVGDTAGAGGWSRSIRNIPVFAGFAEDIRKLCPQAFVANYTNPMSTLTATLAQLTDNPVSGFCHAYFEIKDVIQKLFGLADWSQIAVEIAGMNHFTWVTDFKIGNQGGYPLLRHKIGAGSIRDIAPRGSSDEIGIFSAHNLFVELYDAYGYLPYPADRHTSEFVSFTLTGRPPMQKKPDKQGHQLDVLDYCSIVRTPIEVRQENAAEGKQRVLDSIAALQIGTADGPKKSRETGADMIWAYLNNKTIMDAVNTLNIGQIEGLPRGACVETMGVVDGFGVRPVLVNAVPEPLLEIMRPQAINSKWLVEGMLNGNKHTVLHALDNDPQCAHLKPHEVRALADELIEANRAYVDLPF
jgi:alpha-galactosidase